MEHTPEMSSSALVELLVLFEEAGISVWLDGGWGVDALLQTQTRAHKDVDIVLALKDVPRLRELLAARGFAVSSGKPPDGFVLADGAGLEVDVHAATFDESGDGVYRMQNGGDWIYSASHLSGEGRVGGKRVMCLTPEAQVLCHAYGYALTEKDYRDMELLAERFRLELPPQLRRSKGGR